MPFRVVNTTKRSRPKTRDAFAPWSAKELATLRRLFPRATRAALKAALPARTIAGIVQQGRALDIKRECNQRPRWTREERRLLWDHYPLDDRAVICAAIPRHNWNSIQKEASALGVERITHGIRKLDRPVHPIFVRLRDARIAAKLTRAEIAHTVGGHPSKFNNYELGIAMPTFDRVCAWAHALGFEIVLELKEQKRQPVKLDPIEREVIAPIVARPPIKDQKPKGKTCKGCGCGIPKQKTYCSPCYGQRIIDKQRKRSAHPIE